MELLSTVYAPESDPPHHHEGDENGSALASPPTSDVGGEKTGSKPGRGIYIPPPPDSRPCVVCKKVHLSCDRMRPCGRCIRLQREADCCDPPTSRRGRKTRDGDGSDETKPADLSAAPEPVKIKSEKRQKSTHSKSNTPSPRSQLVSQIDVLPKNLNLMDDPLQVALREGTLRMFWNHYYVVGCTQEYAAMMGYKQEELLGVPWAMLHPPEFNEYYIRALDTFLPTIPEYVTELDNGADLVMISRSGRRFQVLIEYKMFLRNREPLMGWTIVRAILRDNLPPGYMPPGPPGGYTELWNRLPAVRTNQALLQQHQQQQMHPQQQPSQHHQAQQQPSQQQPSQQHQPSERSFAGSPYINMAATPLSMTTNVDVTSNTAGISRNHANVKPPNYSTPFTSPHPHPHQQHPPQQHMQMQQQQQPQQQQLLQSNSLTPTNTHVTTVVSHTVSSAHSVNMPNYMW